MAPGGIKMAEETSNTNPGWDFFKSLIPGQGPIAKSLAKLINTVSDQITLSLAPVHAYRDSIALADGLRVEAQAKADVAVIEIKRDIELKERMERACQRLAKLELRRQRNIESITAKTAKELPEKVSDEPVDQDWVASFFDCCQD